MYNNECETMTKTYRLEGDYGKLIVASYDKQLLIDFARRNGLRGTLKKQYEPNYILRLMRDRNKLIFKNNNNYDTRTTRTTD